MWLCVFVGCGLSGGGAAVALGSAVAARSLSLSETGQLHRTGSHGLTLNEQGIASGTIRGSIYIHLNLSSTSRVTAEVNIYPSGGSLTGHATASYSVHGGYASFLGTMSIVRGSGRHAHAHANALRFAGTIKRLDDTTKVEVSGRLSY